MPHSLGILYEQVTDYLGFLHSSDEYKVMALASFGKPRYLDEFREHRPARGRTASTRSSRPAGGAVRPGPRSAAGRSSSSHYDIAHSLQVVLEETVLELARWLHAGHRRATTSAWPAAWP